MELVSAIMVNSHYAIAKVQKVFGLTSGKGEKFGSGQEKSPKIKKSQNIWNLLKDFISLHRQNVVRGRENGFRRLLS